MATIDTLVDTAFEHHRQGHLEEAESLYRTVLEMDPKNFQGLQLMGTLMLNRGLISEALSYLEQALMVLKKRGDEALRHASLYNNAGIALRALGRPLEAIAYFKHGLTLNKDLVELHISLGGALFAEGQLFEAEKCFETALALNPNLPDCLCDLGTLRARNNKREEAIVLYRRVLSLDPHHRTAQLNLTRLLKGSEPDFQTEIPSNSQRVVRD